MPTPMEEMSKLPFPFIFCIPVYVFTFASALYLYLCHRYWFCIIVLLIGYFVFVVLCICWQSVFVFVTIIGAFCIGVVGVMLALGKSVDSLPALRAVPGQMEKWKDITSVNRQTLQKWKFSPNKTAEFFVERTPLHFPLKAGSITQSIPTSAMKS